MPADPMPADSSTTAPTRSLLEALIELLAKEGHPVTEQKLLSGLPYDPADSPELSLEMALRATRRLGFSSSMQSIRDVSAFDLAKLARHHFPLIVFNHEQGSAAIAAGQDELTTALQRLDGEIQLLMLGSKQDTEHEQLFGRVRRPLGWFRRMLSLNRSIYIEVIAGSVFINVFALAMPLFVMNVYDRVVPNQAEETLWVLAIGLAIVLLFDFILKSLRGYFIDIAGRRADLMLSAMTFEQVMGLPLAARPSKVGSFANQLLDFEQLRDFLTSSTLTALIDLPFVAIYLMIIFAIGGSIALIPLLAILIICATGIIVQRQLRPHIENMMQASARKSGLLIETLNALDLVKSSNAESQMQNRWERQQAELAELSLATRLRTLVALNIVQWVQGMTTLLVVAAGVYAIQSGQLTMGGLIACTILTGRSVQPMTQLASLITRAQQAMAAFDSVDHLMHLPQERDLDSAPLHRPALSPSVRFVDVHFTYEGQPFKALSGINLNIEAGERVGIIGPTGSGKSTLAQLICRFYTPDQGSVLIGGTDVRQIDPIDLRPQMSYLTQDAPLISGSVSENIRLGKPSLPDEAVLNAASIAGIKRQLDTHPEGFDLQVGEQGRKLSGGQKQAIAIARAIAGGAKLVLLDEPSNALDGQAEQALISSLSRYLTDKTLILMTHRSQLLALVDRLVVLREGQIIMDGPKDHVLSRLSQNNQQRS